MKLKGTCKKNMDAEEYDSEFYFYGSRNGKPYLRGKANSQLFFDLDEQRWKLQSVKKPSKFLLMKNGDDDATPFGTELWTIGSKYAMCRKLEGEEQELTLSMCFPDKYTCNDGMCIPLRLPLDTKNNS